MPQILPTLQSRPAPAEARSRLFELHRQHMVQRDSQPFHQERVVSPWFAQQFKEAAAASFRRPPQP